MELHHKYIDYINKHYCKYSQSDVTSIIKKYESKVYVWNRLNFQLAPSIKQTNSYDINVIIANIRDEAQCYDYIKEKGIKPFSDDWYELILNEELPEGVFDGDVYQIMNFKHKDINIKCIPIFKFKASNDLMDADRDYPFQNILFEHEGHVGMPFDFYRYEVLLDRQKMRWVKDYIIDNTELTGVDRMLYHTGFNIDLLNPISGKWLPVTLHSNINQDHMENYKEYCNYDLNTKVLDFPSIKLHLENIKKYGKK